MEQGTNTASSTEMPPKRKRGRPRKSRPPVTAIQGERSGSTTPTTNIPLSFKERVEEGEDDCNNDEMVGQMVTGIIENDFDGGYLLNVRAGDNNVCLRGVVFKEGCVVPVTPENDIAPDAKMYKRTEYPIPMVNSSSIVGQTADISLNPTENIENQQQKVLSEDVTRNEDQLRAIGKLDDMEQQENFLDDLKKLEKVLDDKEREEKILDDVDEEQHVKLSDDPKEQDKKLPDDLDEEQHVKLSDYTKIQEKVLDDKEQDKKLTDDIDEEQHVKLLDDPKEQEKVSDDMEHDKKLSDDIDEEQHVKLSDDLLDDKEPDKKLLDDIDKEQHVMISDNSKKQEKVSDDMEQDKKLSDDKAEEQSEKLLDDKFQQEKLLKRDEKSEGLIDSSESPRKRQKIDQVTVSSIQCKDVTDANSEDAVKSNDATNIGLESNEVSIIPSETVLSVKDSSLATAAMAAQEVCCTAGLQISVENTDYTIDLSELLSDVEPMETE